MPMMLHHIARGIDLPAESACRVADWAVTNGLTLNAKRLELYRIWLGPYCNVQFIDKVIQTQRSAGLYSVLGVASRQNGQKSKSKEIKWDN